MKIYLADVDDRDAPTFDDPNRPVGASLVDDDSKEEPKNLRVTKNNGTPMMPLVENLIHPPSVKKKKEFVDFTENSDEEKNGFEEDDQKNNNPVSPEKMLQEIENLIENLNFYDPFSSSCSKTRIKIKENLAKKRRNHVLTPKINVF